MSSLRWVAADEVQLPGGARLAMGGGQVAEQHHQEHGPPSVLCLGWLRELSCLTMDIVHLYEGGSVWKCKCRAWMVDLSCQEGIALFYQACTWV